MTPEQEAHLKSIKDQFIYDVNIKYRRGQEEHGGNLFNIPATTLVDMAIEEAIDQYVYLITLRAILIKNKGYQCKHCGLEFNHTPYTLLANDETKRTFFFCSTDHRDIYATAVG